MTTFALDPRRRLRPVVLEPPRCRCCRARATRGWRPRCRPTTPTRAGGLRRRDRRGDRRPQRRRGRRPVDGRLHRAAAVLTGRRGRLALLCPMIPAPGDTGGDWWEAGRPAAARARRRRARGPRPRRAVRPRDDVLPRLPADVREGAAGTTRPAQADRLFEEPLAAGRVAGRPDQRPGRQPRPPLPLTSSSAWRASASAWTTSTPSTAATSRRSRAPRQVRRVARPLRPGFSRRRRRAGSGPRRRP